MKIKLIATVLLTVIGLALVLGGTTHAQSLNDHQPIHQQTISNTVYLPIVVKPLCVWQHPTVYVAVDKPIMRVGDYLTATGALVNNCAGIEHPWYLLDASPAGLMQPSHIYTNTFSQFIGYGEYAPFTFTVHAVAAGEVTITLASSYIEHDPSLPPAWPGWYAGAGRSVVVRILP